MSSAKPPLGKAERAVVVGMTVNWAAAAFVRAAPTVAVAAAGVPSVPAAGPAASEVSRAGSGVMVLVGILTTAVGTGEDVAVGKMAALAVEVNA